MKKFTFLMALLLGMGATSASAQSFTAKRFISLGNRVTDVNSLVDGNYYAFKCNSKNKFIKIENPDGNKHFANDASLTSDDVSDALAVFKLHVTGEGQYQFETALSGYYMPKLTNNSAASASTEAGTFTIGKTDLGKDTKTEDYLFAITNTDNNVGFDMQDGQFVGWDGGGKQAWYQIFPVNVSEDEATFRQVTCTIQDANGAEDASFAKSTSFFVEDGKTPVVYINPAKASAWYTFTCVDEDNKVSETKTAFTLKLTEGNAPFTYSTNDNSTWYLLRFNGSDNNYLSHANSSDENLYIKTTINSFASVDANKSKSFWRFEKSGYGVKVYNSEAGKYLTLATGENQEYVTLSDEGSEFIIRTNDNNGGYSLQLAGNANACFGYHRGDYAAVWNNGNSYNASKSKFEFYPVVDKAKTYLLNDIENVNSNENILGSYLSSADKSVISNIAQSASDFQEMEDVYKRIKQIQANVTPDVNAYYTMRCFTNNDGNTEEETYRYLSSSETQMDATSNNLIEGKSNGSREKVSKAAAASNIWQFKVTADQSGYYIVNANTDYKLGKLTADKQSSISLVDNEDNAGIYTLNFRSGTKFALVSGEHCINSYKGGAFSDLGVWDGDGLDGGSNNWQIEKVTTIPVAISDANYASVAFPFATQVPDGVKAFYATHAENGMITLTEIGDGIIPANTGAILYHEGQTTANLTITTTDKTLEGNILNPATARRAGFTAETTYVLAKNSEDKAAFLKSELTTVPANKAYINADEIPADASASKVLNFNFGETTGIQSATTNVENTEYFDLQGRRVLYPAHGIFVTAKGQKVLVK